MSLGRLVSSDDAGERLQRTLEENRRLKAELRKGEEKLTRVQTQFRKLSADWRMAQEGGGASLARPGTSPAASLRSMSVNASGLPAVASRRASDSAKPHGGGGGGTVAADLAACQTALAQAKAEVARLHAVVQQQRQQPQPQVRLPSLPGVPGEGAATAPHQEELHQQLLETRAELQRTQQALQQQQQLSAACRVSASTDTAMQQQQQQQRESQLRDTIDQLARERDGLAVRLRLLEEAQKAAASAPHVDPLSLVKLQGELRERSAQVTLLNSRLQNTQAQVETLKGECARLVEELKNAHNAHAGIARQVFQLEHEKSTLQARCGRLDEMELTVQRKNEELLRMEQELLKLMDSLRVCHADTEHAVRREMNARVADLEAMRDEADAQRREKERALLQCQAELAEARRRITGLSQDVDMYRVELSKAEREKAEMAARAAFAGHTTSEFTDEEVHRALAVAAMRRRGATEEKHDGSARREKEESGGAEAALDLYDALHWDETWEQGQLREALATAALDMELAETRCNQLADEAQQSRVMLQKVSEERDTLLEENMELRRRITGVQTVLAKQQLQAYRAAAAADAVGQQAGSIDLCVRGLHCVSPAMEKALGVTRLGDPVSVFLTLDGLSEYDTMLSPPIDTLRAQEPLDVHFRYDGLDHDEATVRIVQSTTFTFQLHRSLDQQRTGSAVVAMAELPGTALLAARETTIEEPLRLIDGDGNAVGTLFVSLSCSHLMLPVLLGRPLADAALLSAAEMRAALVALRSIRFLRVQVFKAEGLPRRTRPSHETTVESAQDGSGEGGERGGGSVADLPQPYVFYTAQEAGEAAVKCIRDTVVHTASRAFTTEPVFDAAPVDHRVVVDRELVRFIAHGTLVFVVFDERATDVRANLGVAEVPLHPLLASPQATIRATQPLHPQGSLSFGVSWVTGP